MTCLTTRLSSAADTQSQKPAADAYDDMCPYYVLLRTDSPRARHASLSRVPKK